MPMALFLLAFQAPAAPPSPPRPPPIIELDFDLARLPREPLLPGACDRSDPSAITVCARRGGAYPLAEMARIFEPGRLLARTRLTGNLTGDVHLERGDSLPADRGAVPNRIMIGLKLPF